MSNYGRRLDKLNRLIDVSSLGGSGRPSQPAAEKRLGILAR